MILLISIKCQHKNSPTKIGTLSIFSSFWNPSKVGHSIFGNKTSMVAFVASWHLHYFGWFYDWEVSPIRSKGASLQSQHNPTTFIHHSARCQPQQSKVFAGGHTANLLIIITTCRQKKNNLKKIQYILNKENKEKNSKITSSIHL